MASKDKIMIDKNDFISFLSKYYLAGETDIASIDIDDGLSTVFINNGRCLLGIISARYDNFSLLDIAKDCPSLNIQDTGKLIKLLKILKNDDIEVSIKKNKNEVVIATIFEDDGIIINYPLCETELLPKLPDNVQSFIESEYNLIIEIDSNFINRFISSRNVLREATIFNIVPKENKCIDIVMGNIDTNVINITFSDINTVKNENIDFEIMSFSLDNIASILSENNSLLSNENKTALIKINNDGLMNIYFENCNYICNYFIKRMTYVE